MPAIHLRGKTRHDQDEGVHFLEFSSLSESESLSRAGDLDDNHKLTGIEMMEGTGGSST